MHLLTLEDVMDVFRLSAGEVLQLMEQGELVGYKTGDSWQFTIESVRAYFLKHEPRDPMTTLIQGMEKMAMELEGEEREELQEALEQCKSVVELYTTNSDKGRKIH